MELQPDEIAARAPAYELAFVEAGRALDAQERAVNELRSRAGVLVAAAAVTTSFFGGRVLTAQEQHGATWIAIGAFGAVGVAVLAVLWPRHDWELSADARDVIAEYIEPEALSLALIVTSHCIALRATPRTRASWAGCTSRSDAA
jgi:hypothetical protein